MRASLALATAMMAIAPLNAQTAPVQTTAAKTDPTSFAASADVRAKVEALGKSMKPGQGFAYVPLVRADGSVAALEYWKAPGRPAVHPSEGEYAIVIEGAGTLISGGTMIAPQPRSAGLVEGDRIEGGVTRKLAPGDVVLIPAGTPHWFGIDGRLVLLGMKIAAARR